MKNETSALLNAPPWSPIRGRIVGRYDLRGIGLRDRELAVPAFEAAWASACRVAKRERNKQRRFELGNERARAIQEARRRKAEAARLADGIKPELNLTIKRKWLDMIIFGTKREEYRAADNRQCLRLWRECNCSGMFPRRPVVAVLRAGYAMDSRSAAVLVHRISRRVESGGRTYPGSGPCGFSSGRYLVDAAMGEPITEHYALGILCVLRAGPYAAVKAWLATPGAERAVDVARAEGAQ